MSFRGCCKQSGEVPTSQITKDTVGFDNEWQAASILTPEHVRNSEDC